MAVLRVNPNRMELANLKEKLKVATRGHKLLKDKQDELMRQFIDMIRKNRNLRMEVEKDLKEAFGEYMLAAAKINPKILEQAVSFPKNEVFVDISEKNLMSVIIPSMKFDIRSRKDFEDDENIYPYGYLQTSVFMDVAIKKLYDVLNKMLELAELEKTCQLLADEIEATRRRVNALEYRTIPDYVDTINSIRMKMAENERSTIVRLMKVKDIIGE